MKILYIFLTATNNKPIQLEHNFNLDDKDIDIMVYNTQDFFDKYDNAFTYKLDYTLFNGNQLLHDTNFQKSYVGNSIFPVFDIYKEKNNYDYYIIHEYDAFYTGNFNELISNIKTSLVKDNIDYILQNYFDYTDEWWWNDSNASKYNNLFNLTPKHCLLQWYCVSNKVMKYILNMYNSGIYGHYELVIPTVLYNSKFNGSCLNLFCNVDMKYSPNFKLKISGQLNENTMYHPVRFSYNAIKYKKINEIFDCIYCLNYEPQTERLIPILKEFERLNISVKFINRTYKGVKGASLLHCMAIEDAMKNSYTKILIFESDVRFLKDIDTVIEYMNNIPDDADIVLFDYIYGYRKNEIDRYFNKQLYNDYYIDLNNDSRVFSAAAYLLSNKGMRHIYNNQRNRMHEPDYFTTFKHDSIHVDDDKKLRRYIPKKPLCIQKSYNNNLRNQVGTDNSYDRYIYQGTKLEEYNLNL